MAHDAGGWGELALGDEVALQPAAGGWADLEADDAGQAATLAASGWGRLAAEEGSDNNTNRNTTTPGENRFPPPPAEACALSSPLSSHAVASDPAQPHVCMDVIGAEPRRTSMADAPVTSLAKRPRCEDVRVALAPVVPVLPPGVLDATVAGDKVPFVASPLLPHLVACAEVAHGSQPEAVNEEVQNAASIFVYGDEAYRGSSDSALADRFGIERRSLACVLKRLASALTLLDRAHQSAVEKNCSRLVGCELLEYIEGCRYDETPLPMKVAQEIKQASGSGAVGGQVVGMQRGVGALTTLEGARPKVQGNLDGALKVMQTESSYTMLLKLATESGPVYVTLRGSSSGWLQAADRMTADVIKFLLQTGSPTSLGALQFQRRTRMVCTDKFSANQRAERAIRSERNDSWKLLHVDCRVHINATIHSSTFDCGTDKENISNMIHLCLSLRVQGQMFKFRKLLRQWIVDHVVLLSGAPSAEAVTFRERAIRMFFGGTKEAVPKLALLRAFANGDWRNESAVEHFSVSVVTDPEQVALVKTRVADAIVEALASSQPSVYPRHRWDGSERSIDDVARLEVVHGLLSRGYALYTAHVRAQQTAAEASNAEPRLPTTEESQPSAEPHSTGASCEPPVGPLLVHGAGGTPNKGQDGETEWQKENTKHRRLGNAFVASKPLPFLIYMRAAMEPLRAHRAALRFLGGEAWERRQLLAEARAADAPQDQSKPRRTYRVVICAEGILEDNFFRKLDLLFTSPELFGLIPRSALNEDLCSHIFLLLSRMGALMELLLARPSRGYPWKLFRVIKNRALAPSIAAEAADNPCLLDPFAAQFLAENDLQSDDAFHRLVAVASHTHVDIAGIESLHAVIRRFVFQKSVHTQAPSLERISADFVAYYHRQRNRMVVTGISKEQPAQNNRAEEEDASAAKSVAPGAYRAFVATRAQRDAHGRFVTGQGAAYRALEGAEQSAVQEMATSAEEAVKAGQVLRGTTTFGPSTREVQRNIRERAQAVSLVQAKVVQQDGLDAHALAARVVQQCRDTTFLLPECRRALRACSTLQLQQVKHAEDTVRRCIAALPAPPLRTAAGDEQELRRLLEALTPIPSQWLRSCVVRSSAPKMATSLVAWGCNRDTSNAEAKRAQVGACLDAHWQRAHTLVFHADVPKIGSLPRTADRCFRAGVCLCSAVGKQVLRFRNALHRLLRAAYPLDSPARSNFLLSGCVFCAFEGAPVRADECEFTHTFLHISLMRLSPLEVVFQPMVDRGCVNNATGERRFEATVRPKKTERTKGVSVFRKQFVVCMHHGWL